jgi:Xaa-Pro aminopeptidase
VGVVEFEPPILTSWHEEPLEPGMVFSVDIPMFGAPWGGLRIEDGFLVGPDGAEPLVSLSRELRRISP